MTRAQLAYARKDYLPIFCGYGSNAYDVLQSTLIDSVEEKVKELGDFIVIPHDMKNTFYKWVGRMCGYYSTFFADLSGKTINVFYVDIDKCAQIILNEWREQIKAPN